MKAILPLVSILVTLVLFFSVTTREDTPYKGHRVLQKDEQQNQHLLNGYYVYYYHACRRRLEETLKKINSQLEMLQDELEDEMEEGDEWTIHRVHEQINFTLTKKAEFLASKARDPTNATTDTTMLDQEASKETEQEYSILKEEKVALGNEEVGFRYILIGLILSGGFLYLRSKYGGGSSSDRLRPYQPVPSSNMRDDNDDAEYGIEMGRQ